jgi:hypothetical protein
MTTLEDSQSYTPKMAAVRFARQIMQVWQIVPPAVQLLGNFPVENGRTKMTTIMPEVFKVIIASNISENQQQFSMQLRG